LSAFNPADEMRGAAVGAGEGGAGRRPWAETVGMIKSVDATRAVARSMDGSLFQGPRDSRRADLEDIADSYPLHRDPEWLGHGGRVLLI
jgi:hypothetical protein